MRLRTGERESGCGYRVIKCDTRKACGEGTVLCFDYDDSYLKLTSKGCTENLRGKRELYRFIVGVSIWSQNMQ